MNGIRSRVLVRLRRTALVGWLVVVLATACVAWLLLDRAEAACNADDGTQFELDVDWVKGKRSNCGAVCTGTASCDGAYKTREWGHV